MEPLPGLPQHQGAVPMAGVPCDDEGCPLIQLRLGALRTARMSALSGADGTAHSVRCDPNRLWAMWRQVQKPRQDWRDSLKKLIIPLDVLCSKQRMANSGHWRKNPFWCFAAGCSTGC